MSDENLRALLLENIHEGAAGALREAGLSVEALETSLPSGELEQALEGTQVIGIRSRTHLTEDVLQAAKGLRAIGAFCIGTNQIALECAAERGIPVFNAPHSNTRSVAELVLAEAVMLMRGIFPKNAAAHRGDWAKSAAGSHEIRGKTLGIVGYGHIGSQVSVLAEAFGMRVLYHDVVSKLAMGNAEPCESLEALLRKSDVVTLHVPLAPDTHNLMSAEAIAQMKEGAFLINASRGTVVDLPALAEQLRSGRLGGAAIDVYPTEPKKKEDPWEVPLRGLDNVILTPHIGGSTQEAQEGIGQDVSAKLIRYLNDGTTTGAVNFPQLQLPSAVRGRRILHIHQNKPGMLKQINDAISTTGANIDAQYLQTLGSVGYVVTDIDAEHAGALYQSLSAVPGTIRCRLI